MKFKYLLFVLFLGLIYSCNSNANGGFQFVDKDREVPAFSEDSAYAFVENQVEAGPRNPNSKGHRQTRQYLVKKLRDYAGNNVFVQEFTHEGYEGDTLDMANIIAAFNTQSSDRIMLCAHWDTRPRADQAGTNENEPITGADDGASGVAVLLELARIFSQNPPPIGVDIIFFDGEDYGREGDNANYFLGSRYWANNPPVRNYNPRFGILLDMVGGQNATFPKEGYSMQFAPSLMNEIWEIADQMGYDTLFVDQKGARISDDHYIVNELANIPTIDIIRHTVGSNGGAEFAPYWHTHRDTLDVIDKNVLDAVGEVLTELIYNRI